MVTQPAQLEARVTAQERQQVVLNARVEELAEDMADSFKQLSEYIGHMDARFDRIEATMATKQDLAAMENRILDTTKQDILAVKQDLAVMENRILDTTRQDLVAMENHILDATKQDLAAMENRIFDAFKQLLTMVNQQRPLSR